MFSLPFLSVLPPYFYLKHTHTSESRLQDPWLRALSPDSVHVEGTSEPLCSMTPPSLTPEVTHWQTVQLLEERWMKTLCTLKREGGEIDWYGQEIADSRRGYVIISKGVEEQRYGTSSEKRGDQKNTYINMDLLSSGQSNRSSIVLRHSGITGQITVSTVSQLDLSDNQSSSRKRCNPGHERVGQGQGLGVTGLTDKRDWCPLTKLEPYSVSAAALPAPQGSLPPPSYPQRHTLWLPSTRIHLNAIPRSCPVLFDHVLNCKRKQRKASVKGELWHIFCYIQPWIPVAVSAALLYVSSSARGEHGATGRG